MKLTKSQLKEMIREELMNEGPANEYAKTIKVIDKHYTGYWHSINDLAELLEDKGFKKDATQLQKEFKKKVAGFQDRWLSQFRHQLARKLM